jgi:hypothetical protein
LTISINELEFRLAEIAQVSLEEKELGAIDMRVELGDDWTAELSRGLRENHAFVAIIAPIYFKRPECGKELTAFVLRSPELGIDRDGALTEVKNVLMIRWYSDEYYAHNGVKDSSIPPILRRIEYWPADDGKDALRTKAIEQYKKRGMEGCIGTEHFRELMNLFVCPG